MPTLYEMNNLLILKQNSLTVIPNIKPGVYKTYTPGFLRNAPIQMGWILNRCGFSASNIL